jgi:hypothetical protein
LLLVEKQEFTMQSGCTTLDANSSVDLLKLKSSQKFFAATRMVIFQRSNDDGTIANLRLPIKEIFDWMELQRYVKIIVK